jgi:hypothetical protein
MPPQELIGFPIGFPINGRLEALIGALKAPLLFFLSATSQPVGWGRKNKERRGWGMGPGEIDVLQGSWVTTPVLGSFLHV